MMRWIFLGTYLVVGYCLPGTANFSVYGNLVLSPCNLSPIDSNIEVDMGAWSRRVYEIGTVGPAIPFSIHLTDCYQEVASTVTVTFQGLPYKDNPELFSIDSSSTADGIAIALLDRNGNIIPASKATLLWRLESGVNDIPLQAQIQVMNENVVPGKYSATVNFELSYP